MDKKTKQMNSLLYLSRFLNLEQVNPEDEMIAGYVELVKGHSPIRSTYQIGGQKSSIWQVIIQATQGIESTAAKDGYAEAGGCLLFS